MDRNVLSILFIIACSGQIAAGIIFTILYIFGENHDGVSVTSILFCFLLAAMSFLVGRIVKEKSQE